MILDLLAALKIPVGKDMDGQVIIEAFKDEFINENPIKFILSHDTKLRETEESEVTSAITEQLKNLGYL